VTIYYNGMDLTLRHVCCVCGRDNVFTWPVAQDPASWVCRDRGDCLAHRPELSGKPPLEPPSTTREARAVLRGLSMYPKARPANLAVTAGTVSDKTGYSLSVTPPTAATIAAFIPGFGTVAASAATIAEGICSAVAQAPVEHDDQLLLALGQLGVACHHHFFVGVAIGRGKQALDGG
jgi:hypothetical protein